ncbi:MAG: FUSC family protein [Deltaproteobacteria bacterium]|nr:FUSC family protein [Deltaproteobacteria bacterium]
MRARLAVVAPDLAKGVRAAIATLVPFYLAGAYGRPELAWVALGGWLGALADPGGARKSRALAALAFAVLGGIAVGISALAAVTPTTGAIVTFVIVFAASLARALGATAGSIGTSIAIAAAIAASRHGPMLEGVWFSAGVAWAALSSTITLPAWPHLPVRLAIGHVFDALAAYADAIAVARAGEWPEVARIHQRAVRAALENARTTALALRARRSGESAAGANLRVILGGAESIFFQMIALAEQVEHGAAMPENLAAAFRAIARDLYTRHANPAPPLVGDTELVSYTRDIADVARDLDRPPATLVAAAPAPPMLAWEALGDALSLRSPIFVHALRVSLTGAAALVLGRVISPLHPTWVVVTVLAVLQPHLGPTLVRAAERVVGTIIGATLALAAMLAFRSPLALTLAMFPFSVLAVITRPRSYRLFVLFLTPVFVLVTAFGHADWHVAGARIVDVTIGGAFALVAALVAPSRERLRLPDALAAMLEEIARYARLAGGTPARSDVVTARRCVGIALEAAEASLERMLAEPKLLQHGVEDAMYLVTYARRVSAGITAHLETTGPIPAPIADYLAATLDDARAHLRSGTRALPRERPHAETPALQHLVRRGELIAQRADPLARA